MKLSEISSAIIERARNIKLLVLDVDGVLTSGQLFFTNSGEELKAFNSLDGHGKIAASRLPLLRAEKVRLSQQGPPLLALRYSFRAERTS
jgi:hypothetical protein